MQLFKFLALILAGALLALCAGAIFLRQPFRGPKLVAGWHQWPLIGATAPECDEGKGAAALGQILVIFLIAAMDNLFRGDVGAGPDSFQLVYDSLMKPTQKLSQD